MGTGDVGTGEAGRRGGGDAERRGSGVAGWWGGGEAERRGGGEAGTLGRGNAGTRALPLLISNSDYNMFASGKPLSENEYFFYFHFENGDSEW